MAAPISFVRAILLTITAISLIAQDSAYLSLRYVKGKKKEKEKEKKKKKKKKDNNKMHYVFVEAL